MNITPTRKLCFPPFTFAPYTSNPQTSLSGALYAPAAPLIFALFSCPFVSWSFCLFLFSPDDSSSPARRLPSPFSSASVSAFSVSDFPLFSRSVSRSSILRPLHFPTPPHLPPTAARGPRHTKTQTAATGEQEEGTRQPIPSASPSLTCRVFRPHATRGTRRGSGLGAHR